MNKNERRLYEFTVSKNYPKCLFFQKIKDIRIRARALIPVNTVFELSCKN